MNQISQLKQNIRRIRKDIRRDVRELSALMDADQDFAHVAQRLMRAQQDLKLYLEKADRVAALPMLQAAE
jgi:hypothetical protein